MRRFKTSKENRTTFNYYSVTGEKIEITPDQVGTTWIAKLHGEDDAMVDSDRRQDYLAPVHYDSLSNAEGDSEGIEEKLDFLADPELDPQEQAVKKIECQEHEQLLAKLREALETLQPQQKDLVHKVFFERRSCASIAAEDGVSRAAVCLRLKKIYAALGKKLAV